MMPSGKKTMHSKMASMFGGSTTARMPRNLPNQPKPNMPKDHSCKVCPGAKRMK